MWPPTRGSKMISDSGASRMWCSGGHQVAMPSVNTLNACSIDASTEIVSRTLLVVVDIRSPFRLLSGRLEGGQRSSPEALEISPQGSYPVGIEPVDAPVASPVT